MIPDLNAYGEMIVMVDSARGYDAMLLKLIAIGHILGGVLLPLILFFDAAHPSFLSVIYKTPPVSDSAFVYLIFWVAILGPTIASWGVLFYGLVWQYFRLPSRVLWWCMVGAVLVWAPYDSLLCLYHGIYLGAVMNGVVTLVLLTLLFRVKGFVRA